MSVHRDFAFDLMADVTRAVWIEQRTDALFDFYHPDAKIAGLVPDFELTVEDYRVVVEQLQLLLQVKDFHISQCVCGADGQVAYRMQLHTMAVANGATAPQDIANFCQFRGDKVAHSTVLTDQLSFFERAGMVSPNQRMTLLAG